MYPGFAKTAREEGFAEVADWFETLARAEKSHANRFSKLLDDAIQALAASARLSRGSAFLVGPGPD